MAISGASSVLKIASRRVWDGDSLAYASSAVDLLSLAHEVSERIKSETELHATRERHRAFIQASLDSHLGGRRRARHPDQSAAAGADCPATRKRG